MKVPYAGSKGKLVWLDETDPMRVQDNALNGVAFISGRKRQSSRRRNTKDDVLLGSGVIMSHEQRGIMFPYFVTARHVVDNIIAEAESYPGGLWVHFNDNRGRPHRASVPAIYGNGYWEHHPDEKVDLAITPLREYIVKPTLKGISHVPSHMLIRDEQFHKNGIGVGDEVFVVGLFHFVTGETKNTPIVRVGNLAMIPDDRIYTGDRGFVEAYLVDIRSIGGLSGSPVFVRESIRVTPENSSPQRWMSGNFYMLGIMHGSWYIDPKTLHSLQPTTVSHEDLGLNVGVAVVVPARKVRDLIMEGPMKKERDEYCAGVDERNGNNSPIPLNRKVSAVFQVPKDAVDKLDTKKAKPSRKKSK